jgi:hypothetical protein
LFFLYGQTTRWVGSIVATVSGLHYRRRKYRCPLGGLSSCNTCKQASPDHERGYLCQPLWKKLKSIPSVAGSSTRDDEDTLCESVGPSSMYDDADTSSESLGPSSTYDDEDLSCGSVGPSSTYDDEGISCESVGPSSTYDDEDISCGSVGPSSMHDDEDASSGSVGPSSMHDERCTLQASTSTPTVSLISEPSQVKVHCTRCFVLLYLLFIH